MSEVNNKILKAHEDETSGALVAEFVDATMPGSLEELAAQVGELDTEINAETTGLAAKVSALEEVVPELPAVTSDDNGDVLTVVEGVWSKASIPTPSGGGKLVYFFTQPMPRTDIIKLRNDKTVADITACLNEQKIPVLVHGGDSTDISYTPYAWTDVDDSNNPIYVFSAASVRYDADHSTFVPFISAVHFETTDPTETTGHAESFDVATT